MNALTVAYLLFLKYINITINRFVKKRQYNKLCTTMHLNLIHALHLIEIGTNSYVFRFINNKVVVTLKKKKKNILLKPLQ